MTGAAADTNLINSPSPVAENNGGSASSNSPPATAPAPAAAPEPVENTSSLVSGSPPTMEPAANPGDQTVTPPAAVAPTPTGETPPPAAADTAPKTAQTPQWAQDRINELTAKKYAAERLAEQERERRVALENVNKDLLSKVAPPGQEPTAKPTPPSLSEEEVERRANEKAAQIARANEFNKACNNIVEVGKKEYKDWDDAVKNLTMVGAIGQNVPADFLETAIELKDPHKVLHYLGTNLDEAERIIKSSPKKMAMELARLEATLSAPAPAPVAPAPIPLSQAPAPVIPVTAGKATPPAATSLDDPNLTTEQFMRLREQQALEKRNRYRRA